jgi:lysozyme
MQTSSRGVKALELDEGVVLRAYRCPAGIWTIGAGLTAASGVVKPKAGMVITASEASRLLQDALHRNYEPAVAAAMPKARQHEFDAGVSFHFNTGAIARATWVKLWREHAEPGRIRNALLAWNKGGGKVLPGLTARRKREYLLLVDGVYHGAALALPSKTNDALARIVVPMDPAEILAVREAFERLGYPAGDHRGAVSKSAVLAFQQKHGLTVDGVLGRATLSTLQRMMDARTKSVPAVAAPAAGGAASVSGAAEAVSGVPFASEILLGLGCAFALYTAWSYRDAIAAAAHDRFPRLAAKLRSF